MALVHYDMPQGLAATGDRGTPVVLKRYVVVEFTTEEIAAQKLNGPMILYRAEELLDASGLTYFSTLKTDITDPRGVQSVQPITLPDGNPVLGTLTNPFANLVLVRRSTKVRPEKNQYRFVDVELEYEHIMAGFNQILPSPPSGRLFVKLRSSIVDKPTNFYYPFGDRSRGRRLIEVAHTFAELDTGIPNTPFDPDLPRTVVQSGEINLPFPGENFTLQVIYLTTDIVREKNNLLGRVNSDPILGQPEATYICSEFSAELLNASYLPLYRGKAAYKVSMEFQYNYDTWDATAVFNDQRTHAPPATIQKGQYVDDDGVFSLAQNPLNLAFQPAGYWRVPALARQNFSQYFGNVIFEAVGPITPPYPPPPVPPVPL